MTLLDYPNHENYNYNYPYYFTDQFTHFTPPKQLNYYSYDTEFAPLEPELLNFDPLPPSLFAFDIPPFDPPTPIYPEELPFYPYIDEVPFYEPAIELPITEDGYYSVPKKNKVCFPEFGYGDGGGKTVKKAVSAQSKAARERRRRITEKTQELGKIVPGAHKMNTAQMFQAASNYVLFLQAQLALLNTIQDLPPEDEKEPNLSALPILGSPIIQEKLYTKEKCLVPMDFLPLLQKHMDIETNPTILKQIKELMH